MKKLYSYVDALSYHIYKRDCDILPNLTKHRNVRLQIFASIQELEQLWQFWSGI